MLIVVICVVCLAAAVFLAVTAHRYDFSRATALIPVAIAAVAFAFGSFYTQDAGEVCVLLGWSGTLDGYTEEPGLHTKTPLQGVISYDVRNNLINLYRDSEYSYDGGAAQGACVTVNDKGGASADIDLQVVYSLDADSAISLYEDYGTQSKFTSDVILNDVRAVAREVAGQYDTITLLTNRGEFTRGLNDALAERWDVMGLNVEQVSIQDVRYADSIREKFNEAQAAEVAKSKALNDQETAKVNAETKSIEAQGEADANRILTESLTPEVIQQHYIETLGRIGSSGNLVVVPEGSNPLVRVGE